MREVQYLREYHRNCCETHQLSPEFWIESKIVKYVYSYCILIIAISSLRVCIIIWLQHWNI